MSEYNILHDIFFFNFIDSSCNYWFIFLNKYNFIYSFFYNFFYNFILIILIIYPLYNYIKLLIHLKIFLNEFYNFLPLWARAKAKYIVKYLVENFPGPIIYANLFYFYWYFKKWVFIKLIIRYENFKKEDRKLRHMSKQFISYIYIRFVLTYFYGLFFRLFYFFICFFLKFFYFLIKKIIIKISYNSNWIIFFKYLEYRLRIYSLYLGYNFFLKIFTFLNYIKLEFFTYFINPNNFMGGLIFYFYHGLTYYISKYNNNYTWVLDRLPIFYPKIITYIYKYNYIYRYSFYLKKNLSFFLNLFLISKIFFHKIYNILYYIHILLKPIISYIFKLNIFVFFGNIYLRKIFIFIGFSWFSIYEMFINIFKYIFIKLLKLLFKLKYIIFIYFLYKFGIIYILSIYILSIFFYPEDKYFTAFLWLWEYFFDFFGVKNYDSYHRFDNDILIHFWQFHYNNTLEKTLLYLNFDMTFIDKLLKLILPDKDLFYRIFRKRSLILYDHASIWRKIGIYFGNIWNHIINELSLFYLIFKDYFLFKYLSIYQMYIYKWSGINLYYYIFNKILLTIYLSLIDTFFNVKFSYLYLLPNDLNFLWSKVFYIFCKIWFYFHWIKDIYIYIYPLFNYIYLYFLNFFIYYFNTYLSIIYFFFLYIIIYIYYYIIFIYLNIIDLRISFLNYNTLSYYFNSDIFFYYFFKKKIIIIRLKELFLNYLRIDINNLLEFRFTNYTILGTKLRGILIYTFDYVELKELKKRKINLLELRKIDPSIITHDNPAPRFQDYFDYDYKNFVLNNFYFFYNFYKGRLVFNEIYPYNLVFYTWSFYFRNYLFFNNYAFLYIIYYYIIFIFFRYMFKLKKNDKYNSNINQIWINLKNKFNYRLLKNDKLFLKALDFYQETNGKKKLFNGIYNTINIFWNFEKKNNIKIKKNIKDYKNLDFNIEKIKLGNLCKNFTSNKKLNNYIIEKNMCYNDQKFFYWKRFILFGKDFDYYFKNNYDNEILYFFLALVFRRTSYAPLIYYYLDNYKKKYYYRTIYSDFIPKINVYIINYFHKLSCWLNLKKSFLLLDKDLSLLIYKDEGRKINNIYTINRVKILPDFILEFFWLSFIFYLFFFRWCVWTFKYLNKFNVRLALIYLHNLISNTNLFYIYDISDYWFYNYSLFDRKNIAYESNKYKLLSLEFYKTMRKPRMSTRFLINNDPLFLHRMNHVYHLHHLNISYKVNFGTFNMQILNKIINIINIILFIFLISKDKYIILKYMKYNYIKLIYLLINYRKNIIKFKNYIFFKGKILS